MLRQAQHERITGTAFARRRSFVERRIFMSATTIGAIVGAAIDSMSGDDSEADGAIVGAVTANVLKVALPVAATWAVGWLVLRGLGAAWDQIAGNDDAA